MRFDVEWSDNRKAVHVVVASRQRGHTLVGLLVEQVPIDRNSELNTKNTRAMAVATITSSTLILCKKHAWAPSMSPGDAAFLLDTQS